MFQRKPVREVRKVFRRVRPPKASNMNAGDNGEKRQEPKMKTSKVSAQPWFVVSKEGLRKTLERKGKAFAIFELLQNGFDEASTKVSLTLTKPENGKSTLICVDDAPLGYTDLSCAHTMFAESKKKADHKKRGRFNVGEKYVLALCDNATITSTTGRVLFNDRRHTHPRQRQDASRLRIPGRTLPH